MSRTLSLASSAELLKSWAACVPAGWSSGKYSSPCRTCAQVSIQLSMKAACIWATAGPSSRKWESRQWSGSWAFPSQLSAMPTPPVKPTRPSTISSFRWVRLLSRPRLYHRSGWYFTT